MTREKEGMVKPTGAHSADNGSHEMGMEDINGIVDSAEDLGSAQYIHGDPWYRAGAQTEQDGAPASDYTRCGRDGDKSGNHALNSPDDGRLLEEDDVQDHPSEK